ncbi:MAG: Na+/H+ antiporter subunit E [Gammaproteobacteria bacterium]|nr:Na+/H+ antiporter subunit E [Gammaproteobacteria bacterium]
MKRWLPHPLFTLMLALVWLLLQNSLAFGQILLGLLLGWAIPRFTIAFWPDRVEVHRPWLLLRFVLVFLYDVLVANLTVARLILWQEPEQMHPVFVTVPLDLREELAISLLANVICLTPGTVSAHLSEDRRSLLVHALDSKDPEAVIASIKQRYEAPLKEIFAC